MITVTTPMYDALTTLIMAIDDFGLDCADRINLEYKYGKYEYGVTTPARLEVFRAVHALCIKVVEAE